MNYTTHTPTTLGPIDASLTNVLGKFEEAQGVTMQIYSNVITAFDIIKKRATSEIPEPILNEGATTFAQYAAVRSNPGAGNFRMYKGAANKKALMNRPILKLSTLVKQGSVGRFRVQADDEKAYADGYKYKVVNTKLKTLQAYKYTHTKGEAAEAAKIHSRGLLRASWGVNLPRVGARIPNAIQYVFEANPEVKKFAEKCMDIKVVQDENGRRLVIWNRAPFDTGYKTYIKGVAEEMGNRRVFNLLTKDKHFQQFMAMYLKGTPLKLEIAQGLYKDVNSFWTGALGQKVDISPVKELNTWFDKNNTGIRAYNNMGTLGFRISGGESVTFETFGRSL